MTPEQAQVQACREERTEVNRLALEAMGIRCVGYEDDWNDGPFPVATLVEDGRWIVWRNIDEDGNYFDLFAPPSEGGAAAREECEEWLYSKRCSLRPEVQFDDNGKVGVSWAIWAKPWSCGYEEHATLTEAKAWAITAAVRALTKSES